MAKQMNMSNKMFIVYMMAFLLVGALVVGIPLSLESYARYQKVYELEANLQEITDELDDQKGINTTTSSSYDDLRSRYNNLASDYNYLSSELAARGFYGPAVKEVSCIDWVHGLETKCGQ